jgi:hypothetical protein
MADSVLGGSEAAANKLGGKAVEVVADVFVPLGAGLAGFIGGGALLGGAQAISNVVYNTMGGSGSGATANRVGGFVFALIWGGIGYGLWHMRGSMGTIGRCIVGGFGAFFLGTAANLGIFNALLGRQPAATGLVDKLFALVGTVAQGGQK